MGLAANLFWSLSAAEFYALKEQWAIDQAQFRNAHFDVQNMPWIASDLMHEGNREIRRAQAVKDKADLLKVNSKLASMKPGERPAGLPDFWPKPKKGSKWDRSQSAN